MTAPYASELDRLYAEIERLGAVENVWEFCPKPEQRFQEDGLWIEAEPPGRFTQYYMERGQTSVVFEGDYDAMLFEALQSASQARATRIELSQRPQGWDHEAIWFAWFAIMREIMERMKPGWGARIDEIQADVLARKAACERGAT